MFSAKYVTHGSTKHTVNFQLFVWYYKVVCFCKAQKSLNYGCLLAEKKISCTEAVRVQRKPGQINLFNGIYSIISVHSEYPLQIF